MSLDAPVTTPPHAAASLPTDARPRGSTLTAHPAPAFAPSEARYFPLLDATLALDATERALLTRNGLVVSDRLTCSDFATAYAYLHAHDLPVLITTDSILHALRRSTADLLIRLEHTVLRSLLTSLLSGTLDQLRREARDVANPALQRLYADLETYLSVPLALLDAPVGIPERSAMQAHYMQLVESANDIVAIDLFGGPRTVDFTRFRPRGHYVDSRPHVHSDDPRVQHGPLARYFRAMTWLALVDFRFVDFEPDGAPRLLLPHLAAALLLRDIIERANQRSTWDAVDRLFTALIGRSDNTTFADLERLCQDARLTSPAAVLVHPEPDRLLTLLLTGDYGTQQITGQVLTRLPGSGAPMPRPICFMLLGTRFALDSWVLSALVYDRLQVDGRAVKRALPSPLDVFAVLGNDRAMTHLQGELERYGYWRVLDLLHREVAAKDATYWQANLYLRWLAILRTLHDTTATAEHRPRAMRTSAWADKMLQTQLASWAQLRHDTLLYVKQSYTFQFVCDYPAGYVEPYPGFYQAVGDYAAAALELFATVGNAPLVGYDRRMLNEITAYFARVGEIAGSLQQLAEKELQGEALSEDDRAFIRTTARREVHGGVGGCGPRQRVDELTGWYLDLFLERSAVTASHAVIADVHTNPNQDPPLAPPRVVHAATGPVALAVCVVDQPEDTTAYAGPVFTYYERVTEGLPLQRLTDEEWRAELAGPTPPAGPAWTRSFRREADQHPVQLALPSFGAIPPTVGQ